MMIFDIKQLCLIMLKENKILKISQWFIANTI